MVTTLFFIGLIILTVMILEVARVGWLLRRSKQLTDSIWGFERINPNSILRIAIVGDSTAYSTGVSDVRHSIAGQIATNFPDAHIENWAKSGMKLSHMLEILTKKIQTGDTKAYDIILIMAGGMNVVHFTPLKRIGWLAKQSIHIAKNLSKEVIVVIPHNPGLVPMFHFPFSQLYGYRAKKLHDLYTKIALQERVGLVNLFGETEDCLSIEQLYSPDKTHPNDAGYERWYHQIHPVLIARTQKITYS